MQETLKSDEVVVGYHPSGFRIDKTAPPMNMYTQWTVTSSGCWVNPKAVCFHTLPSDGWVKVEKFDWDREE